MPKMFKMRSFLLRSKDQGRTWVYVTTIASDPVEQEGFGEPVMIQLQNGPHAGRLICQLRTGRETPVYQCESDDEGKTWTKAYPLQWTYSRFGRTRAIVGTDPITRSTEITWPSASTTGIAGRTWSRSPPR
jgi:hypothetical protein